MMTAAWFIFAAGCVGICYGQWTLWTAGRHRRSLARAALLAVGGGAVAFAAAILGGLP